MEIPSLLQSRGTIYKVANMQRPWIHSTECNNKLSTGQSFPQSWFLDAFNIIRLLWFDAFNVNMCSIMGHL